MRNGTALTTALAIVALLAPGGASARLASTPAPYMGADTWYAFWSQIDQQAVVRFTNSVVRSGLKKAGYRIIWLDAGWWQGTRNGYGRITVNREQWPNGMAWLTYYIHSHGLKAGIYTDAGTTGCQNAGSYGHYQQDIDTFARWGFDAIKVDFCGGDQLRLDPRTVYRQIAEAVRDVQPRRKMVFAVCNAAVPYKRKYNNPTYAQSAYASYRYARKIANSWRTGPDEGVPDDVSFSGVLRNIALDARHPSAAGGGHWNDPDYLTPGQGMTSNQARAQFTMWAILAAPLMISAKISELPKSIKQMYEDRQAIAIDQDPLGIQGRRVASDRRISVWVKRLKGRAFAVAFLNVSPVVSGARLDLRALGLRRDAKIVIENIWRHTTRRARGAIHEFVPAGGAVLLRISRR